MLEDHVKKLGLLDISAIGLVGGVESICESLNKAVELELSQIYIEKKLFYISSKIRNFYALVEKNEVRGHALEKCMDFPPVWGGRSK